MLRFHSVLRPSSHLQLHCRVRIDARVALVLILTVLFPLSAMAVCPSSATLPQLVTPQEPKVTPVLPKVEKRIAGLAAAHRYRAITFGDSIMFGWNAEQLSQVFQTPVLNAAIGGGTQTLLWELQAMDWSNQSPNDVVLLLGTNNLGAPACAVFWGLQAAISALDVRFPKARILYVSILPRGDDLRWNADKIGKVDAEMKAAADHRYVFIDAHDAFLCDHRTPCALFKPGNLHLTPQGYQVLTPFLVHAVRNPPP